MVSAALRHSAYPAAGGIGLSPAMAGPPIMMIESVLFLKERFSPGHGINGNHGETVWMGKTTDSHYPFCESANVKKVTHYSAHPESLLMGDPTSPNQ